jgi:hypothetical protein
MAMDVPPTAVLNDPAAESEMADASYYRLEGRRVWRTFELQR